MLLKHYLERSVSKTEVSRRSGPPLPPLVQTVVTLPPSSMRVPVSPIAPGEA